MRKGCIDVEVQTKSAKSIGCLAKKKKNERIENDSSKGSRKEGRIARRQNE